MSEPTPSLTVGGLPGTGTTTLCQILEAKLGLPYTYAGALFRAAAEERGMDLASFGRLCQSDATVDQELDDRQLDLLRKGGLILEGRLAGWHAKRHRLPALKVWVTCAPDERIRRLVERDGGDAAMQEEAMLGREASEADRYRRYYDIDLSDTSIYDLVLDSTHMTPERLAKTVVEAWNA